jgi:hypothetical protein
VLVLLVWRLTLEALADGGAGHVHLIALLEHGCEVQLLPRLVAANHCRVLQLQSGGEGLRGGGCQEEACGQSLVDWPEHMAWPSDLLGCLVQASLLRSGIWLEHNMPCMAQWHIQAPIMHRAGCLVQQLVTFGDGPCTAHLAELLLSHRCDAGRALDTSN